MSLERWFIMKNVFVAMALTLGLLACGSPNGIDMKPDTSGSGGSSSGSMGNGSGGDAGVSTCDCPTVDGARLTRQYLVGDDGSRMESFVWYDKELDLKCSYQSLPNGQTYCVPTHEAVNTYFDANCVIPAYAKEVGTGSDITCIKLPSHARYGHIKSAGLCGVQSSDNFTMFRVNPDKLIARAGTYYEKSDTGACVSVFVGGGSFEAAMWEVVEVRPLSSFVKAVSGVGF
jgi:hypothetical protein